MSRRSDSSAIDLPLTAVRLDRREGLLGALRAEPSLTLTAAAARFGVPITTAWRWMHVAGIERPPRGRPGERPTLAEREGPRLRAAWPRVLRGELRIDALADELDVTPNTVYVAARRLGLLSPRRQRRGA